MQPIPQVASPSLARDLTALARPRLATLGLLTVVLAYVIALPPAFSGPVFVHLVVGSLLALTGASVMNQVLEVGRDALMRRTAERPLPAGRLASRPAAALGVVVSALGVIQLAIGVNVLAAVWACLGLASYLAVYTPLKTHTSLATVVGAVPGAVPVMMGWAAARGDLDRAAWTLFAILFLWQLPHFLAIAWMYRTDYSRAGFRMLPVEDPAGGSTARQVVLYAVALLPVSVLPAVLGLAGPVYFVGALALGMGYLVAGVAMGRRRTAPAARRLLRVSVLYLPALLLLLAIDRVLF